MPRLSNKVALITGGAVGMGAAHARLFAKEDAKVVIGDINTTDGERLAGQIGDSAMFVELDVTDPRSWEAALDAAEAAFGTPTVLVNNAGVAGPIALTAELSDEAYYTTIAVDEHGVFHGMRAVIPRMAAAGGGSIVNISSIAGYRHAFGTPNIAYTTAKFAVRGLTKVAAVEYAQHGIRVNSVHPGPVLTPMMAQTLDRATQAAITSAVPLGRMADPMEVSYAVLFLASDESSYVTGAELVVDGGMIAR